MESTATNGTMPPQPHPADLGDKSLVFADRDVIAERRVLGSVLRWNAAIDEVCMVLRPADFSQYAHQRMFTAMVNLHERCKPIDLISVAEELKSTGAIEDVRYEYLSSLWDDNPTGAHAAYYAGIVRDKAIIRGLAHMSAVLTHEVNNPTVPVAETLAALEREVFSLSELGSSGQSYTLDESLAEAMERIDARAGRNGVTGLSTGLIDLDEMLSGLQDGELVIIGARPSTGKTSLGIGMACHLAINHRVPTAFFSLEQSRGELGERILCSQAGVDSHGLRQSKLTLDDQRKIADAFRAAGGRPLFIDDKGGGQTMLRIASQCRRLKWRNGIRLIVIDYLQLIEPESRKVSRHEQIGAISRRLKLLAKELGIPVIAMAQLNRDSENAGRPKLSSLRESGDIEQDADVVILLHRAEEWSQERQVERIECIVAKNRNGRTGDVDIGFRKSCMRFENFQIVDHSPFIKDKPK